MIDVGALLILGHGPHYPQGIENYKAGQIVYSLGNFIFDEPYRFANRSFVFGVGVTETNELTNRQVHPVHINNHVPCLVQGRERACLEGLVTGLDRTYLRKSKAFWKQINNSYFSDIVGRVMWTKSLKFVLLPPMSFYLHIGLKNLLRKFGLGRSSPRSSVKVSAV